MPTSLGMGTQKHHPGFTIPIFTHPCSHVFLVVSPCDQIPKNTREQRYGEYIEGGNGKRDLVPKKTLVQ